MSGNITSSGNLDVTATSSFTAADGSNIILDSTLNSFIGSVSFAASSGNLLNVTLSDITAVSLQNIDITGALNVTSRRKYNSDSLNINKG